MTEVQTPPVGALSPMGRTGYDVHRSFCVHTESDFPEVHAIVSSLADEVSAVLRQNVERTKLAKHLRKIVLDLFVAFRSNSTCWVDFPRRKQEYARGTRMHRMHLTHGPFIAVVDALRALGYVEHLDGDRRLGLQSSMRATSLLIEAIHGGHVEPRMVHLDHEPIYFKDINGSLINIEASRRIGQMEGRIVALNKLLLRTDISFELTEEQRREYIRIATRVPEMHRRTFYRVFNRMRAVNPRLSFGGRFYGHAVQSIKSWWRQFVRINGEPVRELDYGGMHIRLLYDKAGTVPPPGDVYDIGISKPDAAMFENTWGVSLRDVLKKLLLVGINAKTERIAVEATLAELTDSQDDPDTIRLDESGRKEFRRTLKSLLDELKRRHPVIAHFIGDDQGIRLQRLDSDIADFILADFVRRGLPIIPIHDSFLVRERDRDLLKGLMETAWRTFVPGVECVIDDKLRKWEVVSEIEDSCGLRDQTGSHMEECGCEVDGVGLDGSDGFGGEDWEFRPNFALAPAHAAASTMYPQ